MGKMAANFKKDPLIPLGLGTTVAILFGGLIAMAQGNSSLSQRFMRARVLAQGATVAVICTGGALAGPSENTKRHTYEDKLLQDRAERRAALMRDPEPPAVKSEPSAVATVNPTLPAGSTK
jgi:hypothetical protein